MERPKKKFGADSPIPKVPLSETRFAHLTRDAMIQLLIRMDLGTKKQYCENILELDEICDSREFYLQKLRYLAQGRNISDKELLDIFNLFPGNLKEQYKYTVQYFILRDEEIMFTSWHCVYLDLPVEADSGDFPELWMISVERDSRRSLISLLGFNFYLPAIYFFYLKHGERETRKLISEVSFYLPDARDDDPVSVNEDPILSMILADETMEKLLREKRNNGILEAFKNQNYEAIVNDFAIASFLVVIASEMGVEIKREELSKKNKFKEVDEETGEEIEEDSVPSPRKYIGENEVIMRLFLHKEVDKGDLEYILGSPYFHYFMIRDNRTEIIKDYTIENLDSFFLWALPGQKSTEYLIGRIEKYEDFLDVLRGMGSNYLQICDAIFTRAIKVLTVAKLARLIKYVNPTVRKLFQVRLRKENEDVADEEEDEASEEEEKSESEEEK